MQELDNVLETDELNSGRIKINDNFTAIKSAVDTLEETPDDIEIITSPQSVPFEGTVEWTEAIPTKRLYGIYVGIAGLTETDAVTIEFFGDDGYTDLQYVADFTFELDEDTAQAWRYRTRTATNEIKIRATNTGPQSVTITLTIRAEPF